MGIGNNTRSMINQLVALVLIVLTSTAFAMPAVDPRLAEWMIVGDIPPFVHSKRGDTFRAGGSLQYGGAIVRDKDVRNLAAATLYLDKGRKMGVHVELYRHSQGLYVAHEVESGFRTEDGKFSPGTKMLKVGGGVVYFHCGKRSTCVKSYGWVSGGDVEVSLTASCGDWLPDESGEVRHVALPCPEPTKILQAYLSRYPSSLSFYSDGEAQTQRWWKREAEYMLAIARYEMDRLGRVASAPMRLMTFAQIRSQQLEGPPVGPEVSRIQAIEQLQEPVKHQQLLEVWDEYNVWWMEKYGRRVDVFAVPTPIP